MATTISESTLIELGQLIDGACKGGDSVSAIAERAGVQRELVSGLRNGTYRSNPTIDKIEAICDAIGVQVCFQKK